jgi:branched-chain amino acid transport system ATP-binding protein
MINILDVSNVGIRFGGLQALKNVSLVVGKDRISALIGPNGAGKTTLFNIISGFLTPNEGKIIYEGKEIQGMPPFKLTEIGISRTFQNTRLLQDMTVLENVQLGYHCKMKQAFYDVIFQTKKYNNEEKKSKNDALEVLEFAGMVDLKDEFAKNLPYGYQKKLEIARTIATGARLILLDEPCAGMNTAEKEALGVLIESINRDLKKTILLIEHDMRFVMNLSKSITVLNQGRVIAEGEPTEIQNNPYVIEAYLGRTKGGGQTSA